MTELQDVEEVEGLGKVGRSYGDFYNQLKAFRMAGAKYHISVRDLSYKRLQDGSEDGTRTCHALIYLRNSSNILVMVSPLVEDLGLAEQAVEANRKGEDFVTQGTKIYNEYAKIAEQDKNEAPEKRRAIFLPEKGNYIIKPDSMEARTLFQDIKEEYFYNLAPKEGINLKQIDKDSVNKQKGTTIGYLWFGGPGFGSELHGDYMSLNNKEWAFGVLKKISEVDSHERLPYTSNQIDSQLSILKGVRKGKIRLSELEKTIQFLIALKQ